MNKARDIRNIVLGAVVAVSGLSALAAIDLTTFTPNTPIKSSEVNANFSSLKAMLEEPISALRLATTGTAADGKVLKLQAGNLAWADDLTGGSGGAAYSAGTGIALTGTTFSLADAGVTLSKLSATGGKDGKVLKVSGGKLAWLDDNVGSAGGTYSADDSNLALTGTKFSIKDGGVTASKLAFPLQVVGDFIHAGFEVRNSNTKANTVALHGVVGNSTVSDGAESSIGVLGENTQGIGVKGDVGIGTGVYGNAENGAGVLGTSSNGNGVSGSSAFGDGVFGQSQDRNGVSGLSRTGPGVFAKTDSNFALWGINNSNTAPALKIQNKASNGALIDAVGNIGGNVQTVFSVDQGGKIETFGEIVAQGTIFGQAFKLVSDRNAKTNFRHVNAQTMLDKIMALPITRWNYKRDSSSEQHIGPMAQDFHATFGLSGQDETHINMVDAQGVAFAAIQGLNNKLESENAGLRTGMAKLEARLMALEKAVRSR
jgi:hypothetical protein